jgi:hypothetical protein
MRRSPALTAHAKLGLVRRDLRLHTATTTMSTTMIAISPPIAANTSSSNEELVLKCDAVPRQRCIVMRNVSPTLATPNDPKISHPATGRRGSQVPTQESEAATRLNEKANEIGLRHDTGPSQAPPSTRKTALWNTPLTKKMAASAYRKRW